MNVANYCLRPLRHFFTKESLLLGNRKFLSVLQIGRNSINSSFHGLAWLNHMKGFFRELAKGEVGGYIQPKRRAFRRVNDELLVCRGVAESCPLERTIDGYTRPAECRRWQPSDASHCNFRCCLPTRWGHAPDIRLDTHNRLIFALDRGRRFSVIPYVTNAILNCGKGFARIVNETELCKAPMMLY